MSPGSISTSFRYWSRRTSPLSNSGTTPPKKKPSSSRRAPACCVAGWGGGRAGGGEGWGGVAVEQRGRDAAEEKAKFIQACPGVLRGWVGERQVDVDTVDVMQAKV